MGRALARLWVGFLSVAAWGEGRVKAQQCPAQLQQQLQQQMGGNEGPPQPNRLGTLLSAVGEGTVAVALAARKHPKTTMATAAAAMAAWYAGTESRKTGLLICSSPHLSVFRPPDKHLSQILENMSDAPVALPLPGFVLSGHTGDCDNLAGGEREPEGPEVARDGFPGEGREALMDALGRARGCKGGAAEYAGDVDDAGG
ncbi:unnamed protein product, partial [Discosporangium mesarthrocarpum]